MPARVMRQNKEIKELFRQRIQEKIAREKEVMQKRIDEELPSWISWAIKPLAGYAFDSKRRRDSDKGEGGEGQASLNFWLFLSKDWILVNDVVLEPEPCKADVKTGRTKNGRPYVNVTGSREDAENIRKVYEEKGYNTGTVQKDRYTKGTWFFYLE